MAARMPGRSAVGVGGQPGNLDVDRNHVRDAAEARVALAEDAAGAAAVADRDDELRLRRRVVGALAARSPCASTPGPSPAAGRRGAGSRRTGCRVPRCCSTGCRARGSRARSRCTSRRRPGGSSARGPACAGLPACRRATTTALVVGRGRGLGPDAGRGDLAEHIQHGVTRGRVAAVGEVERLVDQREVGNDVADHRVLEHRPVLPRRIVRMAAADRRRRARIRARPARDRASPRRSPGPCRNAGGSATGARCRRREARRRSRGRGAATRAARRSAPRPAPRRRRLGATPCARASAS